MTHVTVLGPNGINDATFHVHKVGCADLKKSHYRRCERGWEFEASSVQEIVENCFSDFIGSGETFGSYRDGEDTVWQDYANEVRVFPCAGLPEVTEDSGEPLKDELEFSPGDDGSYIPLKQVGDKVLYPVQGGGVEEAPCMWFALCENPAVTTEKGPGQMGDVPICARCHARMFPKSA